MRSQLADYFWTKGKKPPPPEYMTMIWLPRQGLARPKAAHKMSQWEQYLLFEMLDIEAKYVKD